jgi:hypothetical protein
VHVWTKVWLGPFSYTYWTAAIVINYIFMKQSLTWPLVLVLPLIGQPPSSFFFFNRSHVLPYIVEKPKGNTENRETKTPYTLSQSLTLTWNSCLDNTQKLQEQRLSHSLHLSTLNQRKDGWSSYPSQHIIQ